MKNHTKKIQVTVFGIMAMFIVPILAQTVSEIGSDEIIKADMAAVIDSLHTQEPPPEIWVASYYGGSFHGRRTANGEIYNKYALTCAHKTLPFETLLKITNPDSGKQVVVRVNDRGPFIRGRDVDLSYGAAKELGMVRAGVIEVEV
ncbi:MAG: septal ring lytic transglycosylase RlpA family protein, partial [Candidatus Syntrophosphaera sp.]